MANKKSVKKDGFYITPKGLLLPVDEVERFRRNVSAINKRAERQMKKWSAIQREIDNVKTNQRLVQLERMGYRPEFAYSKRTANLGQFSSVEQFRKRLQTTEKQLQKDYIDQRAKRYKTNYCTTLQIHFGDASAKLQADIYNMPTKAFMEKVMANPDQLSIRAVYSLSRMPTGLSILTNAWGFKDQEADDSNEIESNIEE